MGKITTAEKTAQKSILLENLLLENIKEKIPCLRTDKTSVVINLSDKEVPTGKRLLLKIQLETPLETLSENTNTEDFIFFSFREKKDDSMQYRGRAHYDHEKQTIKICEDYKKLKKELDTNPTFQQVRLVLIAHLEKMGYKDIT